jgi:hypothetical protein
MNYDLLLELFIVHISILILLSIIPKYYKVLGIISIPILLYIILYNSKIIHIDINTYSAISIITILIYLVIEKLLVKYKIIDNNIDDIEDVEDIEAVEAVEDVEDVEAVEDKVEEFTDKIKKFKNSESVKTFNMNNRAKLSKRKVGRKMKKSKEGFNDISKVNTAEGFKDEISKYYNSFNTGILKKKSKNTSQSVDKFYVLKDKLIDLF